MGDFVGFQQLGGLTDPGYIGSRYTWCNNHMDNTRVWARLDRFLLNSEFLHDFPSCQVVNCTRKLSDHSPIVLKLKDSVKAPSRFRFFKMWTTHHDYIAFIQQSWGINFSENPLINLHLKLKHLRKKLKHWNWEVFGNRTRCSKQKMRF